MTSSFVAGSVSEDWAKQGPQNARHKVAITRLLITSPPEFGTRLYRPIRRIVDLILAPTRALWVNGPDEVRPLSSVHRVPVVVPENDLGFGIGSGVFQHHQQLMRGWISALGPGANARTGVLVPVESLQRHLRRFAIGCSNSVDVAGRRGGIAGRRAGADGVIIRAQNVRETERIQIFLEIAEARIIGIVPGAIHHLRMTGIHCLNNVVKVLDVRSR